MTKYRELVELKGILRDIDGYESSIIDIKGDKSDLIYKLNDVVKNLSVISTKIATLRENIENNASVPYAVKNVLEKLSANTNSSRICPIIFSPSPFYVPYSLS